MKHYPATILLISFSLLFSLESLAQNESSGTFEVGANFGMTRDDGIGLGVGATYEIDKVTASLHASCFLTDDIYYVLGMDYGPQLGNEKINLRPLIGFNHFRTPTPRDISCIWCSNDEAIITKYTFFTGGVDLIIPLSEGWLFKINLKRNFHKKLGFLQGTLGLAYRINRGKRPRKDEFSAYDYGAAYKNNSNL